MYKAILVGVDGSATANAALERAAKLASSTGAQLHVVSAYHNAMAAVSPVLPVDPATDAGGITEALRAAAEEILGNVTKDLGVDGLQIQTHAFEGDAADVLIDSAESLGCDLIVVGSRGMRGGKRFLLGSVPNSVAHHADRDVLIVHTT